MKKKVVLVTWGSSANFGTCLQCYALYVKLKNLEYDVSLLTHKSRYTFMSWTKGLLSDLGFFSKLKKIKKMFYHPSKPVQVQKRERFQDDVYKIIPIWSKKNERELIEKTDCFVTGSDQIWNTYYQYDPFFFLDFVGNAKRVAYASSIGTNSINDKYKEDVRKHLLKFNHIGVRENEAVRIISELTGRDDVKQVLDPTFLLPPVEWREMSKKAEFEIKLPKEYMLCYLIGINDWYVKQLQDVRDKFNIKDIIIIPAAENPNFFVEGTCIYRHASPVEFIYLLQHAQLVCTDSFHATALSINHSVPFVEFLRFKDDDKKSQNSRIYDVLNHYGLMNRIYNAESLEWTLPINFQKVQDILIQDRKKSLDYLINAIEN